LTVDEIAGIYRNPLFDSLRRFGLSGGEPTLRDDLVSIVEAVLTSCPSIKEVVLTTNGMEPDSVLEKASGLLKLGNRGRPIKFSFVVSIDGYGETFQKIRRVPDAFDRVSETVRGLKELQLRNPFELYSTCVVQPLNIDNLERLAEFGHELGVVITYVPVRTTRSEKDIVYHKDLATVGDDELKKLKSIIENELQPYLRPSGVLFWREYFKMVNKGKRRLPCYLLDYFAEIDSDGTLRGCIEYNSLDFGNVRDEPPDQIWYSQKSREMRKMARESLCPTCDAGCDVSGALSLEFFYYARFLFKEKIRKLLKN